MKKEDPTTTFEKINIMAAKLKDIQMEATKTENRSLENNRKLDSTLSRINDLENAHRKGDKLNYALANAAQLDGKQIIEAVMEVTQEVQVNMVYKNEFLDFRDETGKFLTSLTNKGTELEHAK